MMWEPWPKVEARHLARYVTPDAVRVCHLVEGRDDLLRKPDGRRLLVRALYEALTERNISYAPEKYDPQEERQQIRMPAEILEAPGEGTCLDLSVLFCGLCLGFDLLPVLIVIKGHALVAVSLERGLREWQEFGRREIEYFDRGLLEDPEPLRRLIDQQSYLALECTGFAHSEKLHGAAPEEQDRSNGVLTFEQAVAVGRKQLAGVARPFRFALDIPSLHYRWGVTPFVRIDPEELAQRLEQIADKYTILPAVKGSTLQPARLRDRLGRLLERHLLFGGRDRELGALDAFVTDRSSGYGFVTGVSGFGKTALLANWVRAIEERKEKVAYHFISRLDDVAGEDIALRSLCQQLVTLHGLRGELPASIVELRGLYPKLLGLSPGDGRRVVVVLDGLDEADGWKVGADLFPSKLPAGVFVVFSARDTGQDWLKALELQPDQVFTQKLETLGTGEIAQLLRSAGGSAAERAADPGFVEAVFERSSGDPFFLRFLVEDIREKPIRTTAQLQDQPKGLVEYLKSWWTQVSEAAGAEPVQDLLGYLLVARGRMGRDDLTNISAEDKLNGFVFENTIEKLRRFVIGNDDEGYALCHPRFQDHVATYYIKGPDQQRYRLNVLKYCAAWEEHHSRYALSHYTQHLDEAGCRDDLLDLLQAKWIQAKWDTFGSYSAVIGDMDIACNACLREPRDDAAIAGLAIARQTARELMLSFPTDLLVAWVEMGDVERALELLAGLSDVRGYSTEQLVTVAEALLTALGDHSTAIAELMSRALSLLPVIRSSLQQLKTMTAAMQVLTSENGLRLPRRSALLEEAERFALNIEDPTLLVAVAGLVADAWARHDADRPRAQKLVDVAREYLAKIEFAPDRMFAVARLLPSLRRLDPIEAPKLVEDVLDGLESPFETSSLEYHPLGELLRSWTTDPVGSPRQMVERIENFARMVRKDGRPALDSDMVVALCQLGQQEIAATLIDEAWVRAPMAAAETVLAAFEVLHRCIPQRAKDWLAAASQYTKPEYHHMRVSSFVDMLPAALAIVGDWDGCERMAHDLPPGREAEVRSTCIGIAGRSLAGDSDSLRRVVQKLAIAPEGATAGTRAACYARAARILSPVDRAAGRKLIGRAVGICLTTLPEDRFDSLLELLAIAQYEDGAYAAVDETMNRMALPSSLIHRLTVATPEDKPKVLTPSAPPDDLDSVVKQLREQIGKICAVDTPPVIPHFKRMLDEFTGRLVGPHAEQRRAAEAVGRQIIDLSFHHPNEAKELLGELLSAIRKINSLNDLAQSLADFFQCGQAAAAAFVETASTVFRQAVDIAADLPGDSRKAHALSKAIEMYSGFGDFSSAQAVIERFPSGDERVQAEMDLSIAQGRAKVGELSAFERAFVASGGIEDASRGDDKFNWAVLLSIKSSGKTEEMLFILARQLASKDLQGRRSSLLGRPVRAMLPIARALGGTAAMASIVDSVQDYDRRLLDAGRLIAEAQGR